MRTKQASKRGTRKRAVTALGVAAILSLASGTTGAAVSPASDKPTEKTAPVITLGEEEIQMSAWQLSMSSTKKTPKQIIAVYNLPNAEPTEVAEAVQLAQPAEAAVVVQATEAAAAA
jgi:hypothetical protein